MYWSALKINRFSLKPNVIIHWNRIFSQNAWKSLKFFRSLCIKNKFEFIFIFHCKYIFLLIQCFDFFFNFLPLATRVYVHLSSQWMKKVEGLCGNYDGNAENEFIGPDNSPKFQASDFGHSWRLKECLAVPQTKPSDNRIFCRVNSWQWQYLLVWKVF